MLGDVIPMVVMTGMFAMIFGIAYIRSRENMAMIEKGLNPRNKDTRPRPFVNLKWGLLLIGSGFGLLLAFIIDHTMLKQDKNIANTSITIGAHHTIAKPKAVIVTDTNRVASDSIVGAKSTVVKDNNTNDEDGDEDDHSITEVRDNGPENAPIYFALIAIGGGLGLFFSYRIEKKEWLDKKTEV